MTRPLTPDRQRSLAILASVPRDVLPDGPARDALIMLITMGANVVIYHPRNADAAWQTPANVTIFIGPALPSWDGRQTPGEFVDAYTLASAYDTPALCGEGVVSLADDLLALWEISDSRPALADAYEHAMGYLFQRLIAWHILPRRDYQP